MIDFFRKLSRICLYIDYFLGISFLSEIVNLNNFEIGYTKCTVFLNIYSNLKKYYIVNRKYFLLFF